MEKIFSRKMEDIDGKMVDMKDYNEKVVLVVNTASKDVLVKQLEGLQLLRQKYENRNFDVVVFPSNSFRNKEPLSSAEIKSLYTTHYGVTYLIMQKSDVVGENINPFYQLLFEKSGYRPEFNFCKYLIDRGKDVYYFSNESTIDDVEPKIISLL